MKRRRRKKVSAKELALRAAVRAARRAGQLAVHHEGAAKGSLGRDVRAFLDSLGDRGVSESTRTQYEQTLGALLIAARGRRCESWEDLTGSILESLLNDCRELRMQVYRRRIQAFVLFNARRGVRMDPAVAWCWEKRSGRRRTIDANPQHALSVALEEFLAWGQRVRRWSPLTLIAYRRGLRKFRDFLIVREVRQWGGVTALQVDDYFRDLHARGVSAASAGMYWAEIKGLMTYLRARGLGGGEWHEVTPPPKIPKRLPRYLEIEEINRLLDSVSGRSPILLRDRAILEFMYATAARVSEVADLKLSHLKLDQRLARVIGKGDKERLLSFVDATAAALHAYLVHGRPALAASARIEHVFLDAYGAPISRMALGVLVKRRAASAGIERPVNPHMLRHTCATHLVRAGVPLQVVQEHLGHEQIQTTTIYAHLDNQKVAETVRANLPRRSVEGVSPLQLVAAGGG